MGEIQWWGYRHINGTIQAKRYFDHRDIEDAMESPFVARWCGPFPCKDRDEAIRKIDEATKD